MFVCVHVCTCVYTHFSQLGLHRAPLRIQAIYAKSIQGEFKSTHTKANLPLFQLIHLFQVGVRIGDDFAQQSESGRPQSDRPQFERVLEQHSLEPTTWMIVNSDCHLKASRSQLPLSVSLCTLRPRWLINKAKLLVGVFVSFRKRSSFLFEVPSVIYLHHVINSTQSCDTIQPMSNVVLGSHKNDRLFLFARFFFFVFALKGTLVN